MWYTFATPIPTGNIVTISVWLNHSSTNGVLRCTVYYVGGGSDQAEVTYYAPAKTWKYHNYLSNAYSNLSLAQSREIESIKFSDTANVVYWDDMTVTCSIFGQSEITQTTKPWYLNGYADSILQLGAIDTNQSNAHSGNCTFKDSYGYLVGTLGGGLTSTTSSFPMVIWQDLQTGVYTDNVTEFSLYVKSEDEYVYQVTTYFVYSDGIIGRKAISFSSYNMWSKLIFTSGILPNKILTKIGFQMTGGHIAVNTEDHGGHYYLFIDDVSLLANVPLTTTTVSWTMRPYPLNWDTQGFTQLTGVAESFTYYIYNFGGGLNENGTAIITTSYGTQNITVTLGTFSFSLTARPTGTNITEFITSQIILENRTIVHSIEAEWVTLPNQTPTATHQLTDETVQQGTDTVAYLGGGLIITLALTLTFGAVAGKDGLLTGAGIGVFLASISGLFPIYGLIISVLIFAVLVVSHTGIPSNGGGTT